MGLGLLPCLALADGGLAFMVVFGMIYFLFGQIIAILVELYILRRWYGAEMRRAVPFVVSGNVFSAIVGLFGFFALMSAFPDGFHGYLPAWLAPVVDNVGPILVLIAASVILEWPFIASALGKRSGDRGMFKANLVCNLVSPVVSIVLVLLLLVAVALTVGTYKRFA